MLHSTDLELKVFPAVPVPFRRDNGLAEDAQREYCRWMKSQPIGGVAVWVHTGRGLMLSEGEREFVFRSWREELGRERRIIAGAGAAAVHGVEPAEYLENAQAMAMQAARLGADALLCFPPVLFRNDSHQDERIIDYHRRLAMAKVPLIVFYLYEAAGGITYSPHVLDQLLAMPEVIGIKMATLDSVMTFQDVSRRISNHFPNKTLISGEDRFLGYSFLRGATSALIGMGAACTRVQHELLQAAGRGPADQFVDLCRQVDELAEHTFTAPMEGYIQRMLWCLVHQGILDRDVTHDPWGPELPEAEFHALGECLNAFDRW